jgi:hypothetical protein
VASSFVHCHFRMLCECELKILGMFPNCDAPARSVIGTFMPLCQLSGVGGKAKLPMFSVHPVVMAYGGVEVKLQSHLTTVVE